MKRVLGCGFLAGIAYASVESVFAILLPALVRPTDRYLQLSVGFTAVLFLLYPLLAGVGGVFVAGTVRALGRVAPYFSRLVPELVESHAGLVALIAAHAATLLVHSRGNVKGLLPFLVVFALLLLLIIRSASSWQESARLGFATNPWTVSVALIGLPWVPIEALPGDGLAIPVVTAIIGPLLVLAVSRLVWSLALGSETKAHTAGDPPSRRAAFATILVGAGVLVASAWPAQTPLTARRTGASEAPVGSPPVILITLDTVRADHLSLYGYERPTSPFLEKLAESSTVYDHALASGAVTLPTHASIFTGLYSSEHGAHNSDSVPRGAPLAESLDTMAEILGERGYTTAGVVANTGYLFPGYGFQQGFEHYDYRSPVHFLGLPSRSFLRRAVRNAAAFTGLGDKYERWYRRAEVINASVFPLLEQAADAERPLFLFVNYMDAHTPYVPPPPFDQKFPGKIESLDHAQVDEFSRALLRGERPLADAERAHMTSQYDGEIAYLDTQLEALFAKLAELEILDRALVIVTADHGEAFGERDLVNHGVSVYRDQVHVPLLVKLPRQQQGRRVGAPVSVVDLLPTVVDVVGLDPLTGLEGVSLVAESAPEQRLLFAESFPAGDLKALSPRFDRIQRAVVSGPYKLVTSTAGTMELFDVTRDPDELEDLASSEAEVVDRLSAGLTLWLDAIVARAEEGTAIDPAALERLRALGYIR